MRLRSLVRKLMMLDPGYRKASFLEQKLDQKCDELRAAIEAAKPVDRTDELHAVLQRHTDDMATSAMVHRFLAQYDASFLSAGSSSDHFVSYSYPTGFWYGCGTNVGDWIQTVAMEQAVRKVVGSNVNFVSVRRDQLVTHHGGTCIMQGWYEHKTLNFLPGAKTRAVWLGTHFSNDVRRQLVALWRQNTSSIPLEIGCRDLSTLKFCQDNCISAYFSRCLTLTLDVRARPPANGRVFCVDCPDWVMAVLPHEIKDGAEVICQRKYVPAEGEDMRQTAKAYLARYANEGRLVITTALHCAQPCLAMGVPVVLIDPGYEEAERFSSLKGLLHLYSRTELEKGQVDFHPKAVDIGELKSLLLENLRLSLSCSGSRDKLSEVRRKIREFAVGWADGEEWPDCS